MYSYGDVDYDTFTFCRLGTNRNFSSPLPLITTRNHFNLVNGTLLPACETRQAILPLIFQACKLETVQMKLQLLFMDGVLMTMTTRLEKDLIEQICHYTKIITHSLLLVLVGIQTLHLKNLKLGWTVANLIQ